MRIVTFAALAFFPVVVPAALAHTIVGQNGIMVDYTGWVDPVTELGCCSDTDCAPYPEKDVNPGYIGGNNFGYFLATGEFIPITRVIPSPDGGYHRCIYKYSVDNGKTRAKPGETRCFAAPLGQY